MRLFRFLAELVLARRWLSGGVLIVLVVGVSAGASLLTVDFSARSFFAGEDPQLESFLEFERFWGTDDDLLLLAVESPDGVLTPGRLRQIARLGDDLLADAEVSEVISLTRLPPLGLSLLAAMPADESAHAAWSEQVLANRLLVPALLSKDGRYTAIAVRLAIDTNDIAVVRPTVHRLRDIVREHDGAHRLKLRLAGVPAIRAGLLEVVMQDNQRLIPISFGLALLLIVLMFRSVHGLVVPLLGASVPTVMLIGLMGYTGEPIGLINQVFLTLIPVIAVADAIHMVSRFQEELRKCDTRREAVVRSLEKIGAACFLTSLTTMIGFLSLCVAGMPILRGFGLYAGIGIAMAYFTILFIVPLALSMSRWQPRAGQELGSGRMERALASGARLATRHPWRVILVSAVIIGISVYFGARVRVNNHLTELLPKSHESHQGNLLLDRHLGGVIAVELDLFAPEQGALHRRDVSAALRATEAAVRKLPSVRVAVPVSGAMIGERGDRARLTVRTRDVGAIGFEELALRIHETVRAHLEPLGLRVVLTGTPYIAYRGVNSVTDDLRSSVLLACFVITILIALLFRSPRIGLLSLIPNVLPLVLGYGLMGAMGWYLDPAPAVTFTIALGIAVDDTIHLLVRYREELRDGRDRVEAIHIAVIRSGRAVLITSLILSAGFSVMLFSAFPNNAIFGALGPTVILTALLGDVFLLPALLVLFDRS